jgi:hypothetical protein
MAEKAEKAEKKESAEKAEKAEKAKGRKIERTKPQGKKKRLKLAIIIVFAFIGLALVAASASPAALRSGVAALAKAQARGINDAAASTKSQFIEADCTKHAGIRKSGRPALPFPFSRSAIPPYCVDCVLGSVGFCR